MLTRSNSKQFIRLCDYVYKQGVLDACQLEDNRTCELFVGLHRANGTFGVLDIQEDISWLEWRYYVGKWCRVARMYKLCETYFDRIYTKNYLWAGLRILFEFYLEGIFDWLQCPNRYDIEEFKSKNMVKWGKIKGRIRNRKSGEMISMIQGFCFDRGRIEKEIEGGLSAGSYDAFAQKIWTLTRPIPREEYGAENYI